MKNENSVVFQQTENSIIVRKSGLEIRQWSMALRNPKMGRITWQTTNKTTSQNDYYDHLSAMKLRAQSTPQVARKCKVKNTLGRKI